MARPNSLQNRLARQRLARLKPLASAGDLPINIAASQAAKLLPVEFGVFYEPKRDAFRAMRAGRGTQAFWNELADAVNVGTELMTYQLANDHEATFTAARDALKAVAERQAATGSWTLRAPEISALDLAVQVFRAQLMHCSRGELGKAIDTFIARAQAALRGNHPPGAVVICAPGHSTATEATA